MHNITILVCLYNKGIDESKTIQSLLKFSDLIKNAKIFIWDNSFIKLDSVSNNLLSQHFKNLKYKHTPENTVLSKVYNSVIEEQNNPNSYLVLFDDDSDIPISFFNILKEQIVLNPSINLFLPQIYSNSILVSPAKDYLIKTRLIKNLKHGILNSNSITAINSGMIISNRVFIDGFRYNEKLSFYGTDNFFMYLYAKAYEELMILDIKIEHDLSFNTSTDVNNKIRIFKEIKRANRVIYSKNKFEKGIVMFNNFIVSLKLCIKYKSLSFLYD